MKFKCDICGNEFSQRSGVSLHKRKVHKIDTSMMENSANVENTAMDVDPLSPKSAANLKNQKKPVKTQKIIIYKNPT